MNPFLLFLVLFLGGCQTDIYPQESQSIQVSVRGEVANPGTFKLQRYATIGDLLTYVKLTDASDITTLNQTIVLKDGDILIIEGKESLAKISINTADAEGLATLPGIGPAMAKRIVDYRLAHGLFQQIEDIMKVKGIKDKLFAKLKDHIRI